MGSRAPPRRPAAREPIFGPPATTPEAAFVRFGNAVHWEADLGPKQSTGDGLLKAALARMKRSEQRLVAEFITELTGGRFTFAEARAVWRRSESDCVQLCWDEPAEYLRFLLLVRDLIDPQAWPAAKPRFRPDPAPDRARSRKRSRRPSSGDALAPV